MSVELLSGGVVEHAEDHEQEDGSEGEGEESSVGVASSNGQHGD